MRRGVTLMELLIAVAIAGLLTSAVTRAYLAGIDANERLVSGREEYARTTAFEDRLTELIRQAYVSSDVADTTTYMVGIPGGATSPGEGIEELPSGATDSLVFTVAGERLPFAKLEPQETFEDANENYGPLGGIREVSLSTSPIGDGVEEAGLFLRVQTPSDGDPSQGGRERLFNADIVEITFEFFDGTAWVAQWDTRTIPGRRLPAAVRVIYRLDGEEEDRELVVRIPLSDVTPDNPVVESEA